MNFKKAKKKYLADREKVNAISLAYFLHGMDMETEVAPKECMEFRSRQLAVLSGMGYDISTGKAHKKAVKVLEKHKDELDNAFRHEITEEAKKNYKLSKIPKKDFLEFEEFVNGVYPLYVQAKKESNYALVEEAYQKIFNYKRKYCAWVAEKGLQGYDVLLDEYEPGYTRKEYDRFFDVLKEKLVPFVKKATEKESRYAHLLDGKIFPAEGQKEFCEYLRGVMCFDKDRTVIAESEHPFTNNNGSHDVRITNHYHEDMLESAIFSAIHEMGHGLYELQVDPALEGTPCGSGASLAVHESQSRFMENMIGRSRAFWETHYPKLQSIFPEQLKDITAEDFYRYCNRVERSLIRTEADELTYSLHVLIRYELEKDILAGKLNSKDVPAAWNAKYKEYLGVDVPDDKHGVLQDMHWSDGGLGYFPTYALGSAYAAQIYHAMQKDLDIDEAVKSGTVRPLADWLKTRLHTFGASKYPKELLLIATGEEFDPQYYVDYLIGKYSDLL